MRASSHTQSLLATVIVGVLPHLAAVLNYKKIHHQCHAPSSEVINLMDFWHKTFNSKLQVHTQRAIMTMKLQLHSSACTTKHADCR
jgi:hypothetical protein